MRRSHLTVLILLSAASAMVLITGCASVQEKLGSLESAASATQTAAQAGKVLRNTFADLSEEEEYYIGRAVSAMILSRYPIYNNQALTDYVNRVGAAAAVYSDRPETFAGYHFAVLDTDEVNALAAPGGFIFITRGLLKRCRNEEMLGAVLAHEVGHVAAKHGLQSIKKSRLVDAFSLMGKEVTRKYGPQELAQLTEIFETVLGDIAEKLIERGYDRKYEYEADRLGVKFAAATGYDPQGLTDFLKTLVDQPEEGEAKGWFKTHPSAADRLKEVKKEIDKLKSPPSIQDVRTQRFQQALKGLK